MVGIEGRPLNIVVDVLALLDVRLELITVIFVWGFLSAKCVGSRCNTLKLSI